MPERFFVLLTCLLSLSFCGCSDSPKGFPKVVPCQIIVLRGTTPVADVEVSLKPVTPVDSIVFFGKTDSTGVCQVRTTYASYSKPGVPEGTYKVILVKEPFVEHTKTEEERHAMTQPQLNEYTKQMKNRQAALPKMIPPKLTKTDTTPLKIDVAGKQTGLSVNLEEYK
ncbi:MAG: hypothetical protein LBQ54_12045 [Planctomycetaceae bacterium]|jgi:hypothetical protein|nr:hypothetical protein [Planctomycetaceae bacterium]